LYCTRLEELYRRYEGKYGVSTTLVANAGEKVMWLSNAKVLLHLMPFEHFSYS